MRVDDRAGPAEASRSFLTHLASELVRLVRPAPRLAPAGIGGTLMFSSRGESEGDEAFEDYGDYDYDDDPGNSTRRTPGGGRRSAGGGAGNGGDEGGRQRTVNVQPDERYWTEYLRIALPIVGLLLMIGLFWFWASNLAGDSGPDRPVSTQTPGVADVMTPPDSTPEATQPSIFDEETATPDDDDPTIESPVDPTPAPEPTEELVPEETPDDGTFRPNQMVVTTAEGVNLRPSASTEGAPLGQLPEGALLTIQSGPIDADGYIWWEVVVESDSQVGFVVEDFIEPAPVD